MTVLEFVYRFSRPTRRTSTIEPHGLHEVWEALGMNWTPEDFHEQMFIFLVNETMDQSQQDSSIAKKDRPIRTSYLLSFVQMIRDDHILVSMNAFKSISSFIECIVLDMYAAVRNSRLEKRTFQLHSLEQALSNSFFARLLSAESPIHPQKWLSP